MWKIHATRGHWVLVLGRNRQTRKLYIVRHDCPQSKSWPQNVSASHTGVLASVHHPTMHIPLFAKLYGIELCAKHSQCVELAKFMDLVLTCDVCHVDNHS